MLVWLGPELVLVTVLTGYPDRLSAPLADIAGDPFSLAERMVVLRRRGMVWTTPGSVELHRVPAALLRARTYHDNPNDGGWAGTVIGLLRAAAPPDPWNNPTVWPTWRRLLPHVLAATDPDRTVDPVTDEVSWLLDRAATYLYTRGEPRTAQPLSERAYTLRRGQLGENHPNTLTTANNLARDPN